MNSFPISESMGDSKAFQVNHGESIDSTDRIFSALEKQDHDFLQNLSSESLERLQIPLQTWVQKLPSLLDKLSIHAPTEVSFKNAWILRNLTFAAFRQDPTALAGKEPIILQETLNRFQSHPSVVLELHLIQELFAESRSPIPNVYHYIEASCVALHAHNLLNTETFGELHRIVPLSF
jgi:hypothetical protein